MAVENFAASRLKLSFLGHFNSEYKFLTHSEFEKFISGTIIILTFAKIDQNPVVICVAVEYFGIRGWSEFLKMCKNFKTSMFYKLTQDVAPLR